MIESVGRYICMFVRVCVCVCVCVCVYVVQLASRVEQQILRNIYLI